MPLRRRRSGSYEESVSARNSFVPIKVHPLRTCETIPHSSFSDGEKELPLATSTDNKFFWRERCDPTVPSLPVGTSFIGAVQAGNTSANH